MDAMTPLAELTTLARVAFTESRRLAGDPNICAVGCGVKLSAGRPAGKLCVQYFVRQKGSRNLLASEGELATWPIPAELDGLPTDVVEVGRFAAAVGELASAAGARATRVGEPLAGGYATAGLGVAAAGPAGFGTLAGICFDVATGAPLALSNAHVWGQAIGSAALQPVLPNEVFGTALVPLSNAAGLVRSEIPGALRAAVAFANAGVWAHIITGLDGADPNVFGQEATSVPADARTETETVSIAVATAPGLPPAGRPVVESVSWAYQRLASVAALDAATTEERVNNELLRVQKASTDAASYTGTKSVLITAEVAATAASLAESPHRHFVVACIYPQPSADRVVRRVLHPIAGQALPEPSRGFLYTGSVSTAELAKGTWAVSLFVQKSATGVTESANVVLGPAGSAVLFADCTFVVA